MTIQKVMVIGAGQMGAGIAQSAPNPVTTFIA